MGRVQKILLVEDDLYICDIYASVLKKAGFVVEVAVSGQEALAKTKKFQPNLVLLDIMIPGVDGIEVLRELRTRAEYKNLHPIVVMVTNLAQDEKSEEARKLGADGYIIKADVTPSQLIATVNSYNSAVG